MGKSVSDYMKIAWNVFGKKVVNRMVSEKAASFVGDICSKYQVEVKYKEDLMFRIRNIVEYLVNCRLEGAPINNKYVSDQIKGPIAHSLANAAASSNDYDNMMADFINWLDDEKLDDIEKCLIEIGHKEGADYIQLFREMFAEVRNVLKLLIIVQKSIMTLMSFYQKNHTIRVLVIVEKSRKEMMISLTI